MRKKLTVFLLIFLTLIGFFYRVRGLSANYSFWVDEASTARFSRAINRSGLPLIKQTGFLLKIYPLTHYLTAFSSKIFKDSELAARLPEVVFGTLLIPLVFLVGKSIFGRTIGLGAALFTCFSYLQIAWSRQARGYTIFEFFFLATLWFLYLFSRDKKRWAFFLFLFFLALSILAHNLGLVLLLIASFYLFLIFGVGKIIPIFGFTSIICLATFFGFREFILAHVFDVVPRLLDGRNYLSYYHSLFWRQYSLFSFLGLVGFLQLVLEKKKKEYCFFLTIFAVYFFGLSFLLHVPFEKYALSLFPPLFILSARGIEAVSGVFKKKYQPLLYFSLIFFILANGNKFTLKPKAFYSLNFDMREIPEIDYKGLYSLVQDRTRNIDRNKIALIEIDADAPLYYLGEGSVDFLPRNDFPESLNDPYTGAEYLHTLEELKEIRQKYQYGFVTLIEHNFRFYPEGMVEFVRENLTLEKREEWAAFSPDWNRWPVELYSWGFESK